MSLKWHPHGKGVKGEEDYVKSEADKYGHVEEYSS